MISFLNVVTSALSSIQKKKDQILYHASEEQFYADIKTGNTIDRVPVKDSSAGKSLTFVQNTKTLQLKNGAGTVIDSEVIPTTTPSDFSLNVQNGHLYIN